MDLNTVLTIIGIIYPPLVLIAVSILRLTRTVRDTAMYFDPDSPVGKSVGTVPKQISDLRTDVDDVKHRVGVLEGVT